MVQKALSINKHNMMMQRIQTYNTFYGSQTLYPTEDMDTFSFLWGACLFAGTTPARHGHPNEDTSLVYRSWAISLPLTHTKGPRECTDRICHQRAWPPRTALVRIAQSLCLQASVRDSTASRKHIPTKAHTHTGEGPDATGECQQAEHPIQSSWCESSHKTRPTQHCSTACLSDRFSAHTHACQ